MSKLFFCRQWLLIVINLLASKWAVLIPWWSKVLFNKWLLSATEQELNAIFDLKKIVKSLSHFYLHRYIYLYDSINIVLPCLDGVNVKTGHTALLWHPEISPIYENKRGLHNIFIPSRWLIKLSFIRNLINCQNNSD